MAAPFGNIPIGIFAGGHYLDRQDEIALLRTVNRYNDTLAKRDAAWITLLLESGMRVGALSQFTVGDAFSTLDSRRLLLRAGIQKRVKSKGKSKIKVAVDHSIYATNAICKALNSLLKIRREMGHEELLDEPLVMSRRGRPMSIRNYQDRTKFWAMESGIDKKCSPHWFRHTKAARILEHSTAKEPLLEVAGILGHTNLNSTRVYTMPKIDQLKAVMIRSSTSAYAGGAT